MSKEVKNQEPETTKSSRKYVALAIVVILAAIGIMSGNSNEDETATTTVATTEQAPVAEQAPAVEEPTIARIDITTPLVNADEPQFEVYADGAEEPLKQAGWWPKFGYQGYVIQKTDISSDFVIKALQNVEINIILRGPDRRDENKKFIPIWVDYTSFLINGEEKLSEKISAWHNKPYQKKINATAGKEYNVHIEWTKHQE